MARDSLLLTIDYGVGSGQIGHTDGETMTVTINDPLPEGRPVKQATKVCSCGHPEGRHQFVARFGKWRCTGGRGVCPCEEYGPVITVPDGRLFSYGVGEMSTQGHPLVNGIRRTIAADKGDKIDWLLRSCSRCEEDMVTAVHVDGGRRTELRCEEHA